MNKNTFVYRLSLWVSNTMIRKPMQDEIIDF